MATTENKALIRFWSLWVYRRVAAGESTENKGSRRIEADRWLAEVVGPLTRRTLRCGVRKGSALRFDRCAARSAIPHEQRPLVREPWPTRGLD